MKNGNSGFYAHIVLVREACRKSLARFFALLLALAMPGLFANAAVADDMSLVINGKAIHIQAPANTNLNENNWGLGLEYEWDAIDERWVPFAMASGFSDSNKNPSYYVGGGMVHRFQGNTLHLDVGAIGFLMTRKNYKNDKPFIGVLPAFSVGTKRFAVNMTYIPKVDPKMVALLFFQFKINLSNFR